MIKIIDLHFQGHTRTIAVFLVETSAGPVLVETGPHSTFPALKDGINRCGYSLKEIQHVFLTHIHFDHGGAAWEFAARGATVYLHPLGAWHFAHPEKLYASAIRIYQEKMDTLWGALNPIPENLLRAVEDEEAVQVGDMTFQALHTPGHAIHHIAWQVGEVVFTGDAGGICIGGGAVMPPCPPPDINVGEWLASIELIAKRNPAALYLTHFGRVDAVAEHLAALKKELKEWAMWMKPHFDSGTDPKDLTPVFQKYVADKLQSQGITGEDLTRYEEANPSWMSVTGLLRFWRKWGDNFS
ncbi:MAG: MBL fold metallo-hydrolase [Saprospiraceae bacterium]|nr:MAG: MBL fold metallo-hydrolase [Saprospiraceae bacterium]